MTRGMSRVGFFASADRSMMQVAPPVAKESRPPAWSRPNMPSVIKVSGAK